MTRQLVALTRDAALSRALQELAGSNQALVIVEDLRALSDELLQNDCAIALLDAAALEAPVDAVVDTLNGQFPELRLLVAGQGAEQNLLATRISSQKVFRFVHKPASPQRLKLFLDAAATQAVEQRGAQPAAAPAVAAARGTRTPGGGSPKVLLIGGIAAVAMVAGAAALWWPKNDASPTAKGGETAAQAAATLPAVATLLQKADAAFAAGRFVASDGSSAAELYREATKLDGSNRAAADGFTRAIENGLRLAEESLLAGKLLDASAAAETLRLIAPDNSRLAFLNTQIARETSRANADASQRQAIEQRQGQIRATLTRMNDRLQRGALLEPATNSAVFHFREAEAIGAGEPAVRTARETLVGALLTAADNELNARRVAAARRLADAAGTIHSSAPGLDVVRRRVDEVATQLATPAPVAEAPAPAPARAEPAPTPVAEAAPAPAAPVAAPTAPQADTIVSASSLRTLKRQDPEYPPRALEQLTSGWVEMEFTVARDGSVRDVIVTQAEPVRIFDSAAVAALKRYRYAPVIRNGEPVPQRARMRMRFTAQDAK